MKKTMLFAVLVQDFKTQSDLSQVSSSSEQLVWVRLSLQRLLPTISSTMRQ